MYDHSNKLFGLLLVEIFMKSLVLHFQAFYFFSKNIQIANIYKYLKKYQNI